MNSKSPFLPILVDYEDKRSPLKNCIRKNYRHLSKWAKRTETNCFRIYDRQIKEHPFAIDFYDGRFCIHYFSDPRDGEEAFQEVEEEVSKILCSLFGTDSASIYWRTRFKRKKLEQYEKADISKEYFVVLENGIKFKVNLTDYLDTGLFLDHRETRKLVGSLAKDKRVLNLFAYTCSFSVYAACGGAAYTKSVDMSNTYTAWGKDNFVLNSLPLEHHSIVRADCLKFLDDEIASQILYDLIVIDPPTVSRSKKMDQIFDVQVDYLLLIKKALKLLSVGGVIFFSTNSRKFDFDMSKFDTCFILEISKKTRPIDFHNPKIHRCWRISRRSEG